MAMSKVSVAGPITLRDVARVAGVHPGTVSRALNPETRALVNERTAERVLEAAKELGYRPNPIARGLRTNRSHTIGVLVPDLMNPLFAAVVRGIEDGLRDGGYTPLIANTDNDSERERVAFEAMSARQVDGFIAATARRDHWLLADEVVSGAKVVLVNRRVDSDALPAVTGDDHEGVRLAVEHLAGLGHERIAHLAGSQTLYTGWSRNQGYVDAMRARGFEPDPGLTVFSEVFTESEGARCCGELLDRRRDFTAIVAGNDLLALGCYDALESAGPQLPRRRLGRRLQRHAVRRPLPARADDRSGSALRARGDRGASDAGAAAGDRCAAAPAAAPARARDPRLDRSAAGGFGQLRAAGGLDRRPAAGGLDRLRAAVASRSQHSFP